MSAAREGEPTPIHRITSVFMVVDAVIAARWLAENNSHNRPISEGRVAQYVSDMIARRWKFNGETIQFDWNGILLNGQHRLLAIVKSGCAQSILIVRGLDPVSQQTMDQGTRRAPSHQLTLAGIPVSHTMAAAMRVYIQWASGGLFGDVVGRRPTTARLVQWAEHHFDRVPTLRDLEPIARLPRILGVKPSVSLAVAMRLHEIDPDWAELFYASLSKGNDLSIDSPIFALRSRLERSQSSGVALSDRDVIGFYVIAWNAWRDSRPLTKIQRPKIAWTAATFPVPH